MATTVGQHSVAAFTSPVNGTTPIDANTVRGNDNTVRVAYVDHDADPGIHVQSSTLASRPTAGTAGRKWITEDSGVYTLWFDDGTNWHPVSSENVALTVLAGENLVKGDVVKVTGWNNGQDLPEVVKTTSALDTAFAVITAAVSSGSMGYATNTGIVQDVNTAAYSVGAILYANGSGGFTSTKPTSGHYQPCAYVLRSNTNNGVYYVEFSSPRIVESSANTASTIVLRDASGNFSAGTITAGALTSTGLVTFASLKGTGATTVTNILDEDNMASDSATALATQQSIKAYVDSKVATVDTLAEVLANGNTTGANNIIVSSGQKITTNTIDETTAGSGVTIDSVLLKDDVVNATDIEVDTISANNGTLAVTLGSTGVATIAQQPILSSLTASQAVFTDASKGLVSNAITGTGNVVMSASPTLTGTVTAATLNATTLGGTLSTAAQPNVTSLGTLSSLAVTGNLTLGADVVLSRGAADRLDLASGDSLNVVSGTYKIAGTDVLSSNTLGSGVTASSLTSVGTLTSLTVSGDLTVDTNTLSVNATSNRVGIGTTSAVWNSAEKLVVSQSVDAPVITGYSTFGAGTPVLVSWNSATSGTREHIWFADSASGGVRGKIATNGANGLQFLYGSTVGMSLDSSGNFIVDTNTLYVDAANNRVGVGTASPDVTMDVEAAVGTSTALVMLKNTSGASASNIAQMQFWSGNTFGGLEQIASIHGINPNATSNNGGTLVFSTSSNGTATTPTERMRLDASGNLGLGTASPDGRLDVAQAMTNGSTGAFTTPHLALTATATTDTTGFVGMTMASSDSTNYGWSYGALRDSGGVSDLIWKYHFNSAAGTERMRLDRNGNLGLGVTPSAWSGTAFQLKGNAYIASTTQVLEIAGNAFWDGTNWKYVTSSQNAERYAQVFGEHRFFTAPSGTAGNNITFTQAMTLDASGNLGIGTTSPGQKLTVNGYSDLSGIRIGYDGNNDIYRAGSLMMSVTGEMIFKTGGGLVERGRFTSGGYFKASSDGVYRDSAATYHEINSASVGTRLISMRHANTDPYGIDLNFSAASPDNNTNYFLSCADSTTVRCYIWSDGDLANHDGVYGTISDERLKQDIVDASSQWDDLKAVRFRKYRMKTDVAADPNAPYQLGVIAQELEQTSPGLVDEHPDFEEQEVTDEDGNVTTEKVQVGTTKTVKSSILLMKAAVALQEAMARIEALEVEVAALKAGA